MRPEAPAPSEGHCPQGLSGLDIALPLVVACHDAGAANLILAWLEESGLQHDCRTVLAGPAAALWTARFGHAPAPVPIADALSGAASLISGTGWASDLEHEARLAAAARRVRSLAVVDHWTNYAERFERNGHQQLPGEIIVSDQYAEAEARRVFPGLPVHRLGNAYLAEQLSAIAPVGDAQEALYLAEPARSDWGRGEPGEFQALDFCISRLSRLGVPPQTPIRLRPHPSDPTGKYDAWCARQSGWRIFLDDLPQLADAIGRAKWVFGSETFAMVVALFAGRSVYCTLPPWAPPCRLPQSGLVHLKDIA